MFRILAKTLLAVILLTSSAALNAYATPVGETGPDTTVEVTVSVNDVEITEEEVQNQLQQVMPSRAFHESVSEERERALRAEALLSLIGDELFYIEAKKNGETVSESEVKKALKDFKKNLPPRLTLKQVLKNSKMTKEDLKEVFRKKLTVTNYTDKVWGDYIQLAIKTVTDEHMKEYYDNNQKKFVEPEKVRLSEILLRADPSTGPKGWGKVRVRTDEVLQRIKDGEDFAAVAKEVSEDPYAKNGGDMGWVHTGSITAEIDAAVSSMEVGQVSEPIQSIYGFHIVKFVGKNPGKLKDFNDLNLKSLRLDLRKKEHKRLWKEFNDTILTAAEITYHREEDRKYMDEFNRGEEDHK